MRKWKWWQKVLLVVGVLLVAIGITGYVYLQPYEPSERALQALTTDEGIEMKDKSEWISFIPAQTKDTTILFYPGGLVEPKSYAPLAHQLAEEGYPTYILKMPLNLAVLAQDKANGVIQQDANRSYVIGGHSLGGAMAARYAAKNGEVLDGVFLLAAYPDEVGDLSEMSLSFLSITGGKDGVINRKKYEEGKAYAPEDQQYIELDGANHGQFGSYGFQEGDRKATITEEQQLDKTTELITEWISK
ncbi:alpha/beta hydrolase [Pontibacillus chungwhensis BH030062]|uniref:Alpha/beta hydrolase n=1 Tax=Pontibacillus chungwhensis BH030062 TaxID=1385513 RepID=A0A0A2UTC9_9BACI|nr:alpha/beta hydrolase [Pontibacillus chungwhensis]KGP91562.1 alpha/beta hydrolase [Pontibacillus chungwhensis BH030062]